jgi:DAACS family dicarboxylate/amino acid:cation (Na+ or H+) symporter
MITARYHRLQRTALRAAGLPETIVAAAIPLVLPVDWIIARIRSLVNVMSDMLVAILLDAGGK